MGTSRFCQATAPTGLGKVKVGAWSHRHILAIRCNDKLAVDLIDPTGRCSTIQYGRIVIVGRTAILKRERFLSVLTFGAGLFYETPVQLIAIV